MIFYTKIFIFDRYGKLIKQLSSSEASNGWNGTFNGKPLPATDYWFTVEFKENNQIRASDKSGLKSQNTLFLKCLCNQS